MWLKYQCSFIFQSIAFQKYLSFFKCSRAKTKNCNILLLWVFHHNSLFFISSLTLYVFNVTTKKNMNAQVLSRYSCFLQQSEVNPIFCSKIAGDRHQLPVTLLEKQYICIIYNVRHHYASMCWSITENPSKTISKFVPLTWKNVDRLKRYEYFCKALRCLEERRKARTHSL